MERYYVVPPIRILTGTKYLSSVSNPLILLFSTSTHVSANFFVFCAIVVTCGLTKRVISFPSYPTILRSLGMEIPRFSPAPSKNMPPHPP